MKLGANKRHKQNKIIHNKLQKNKIQPLSRISESFNHTKELCSTYRNDIIIPNEDLFNKMELNAFKI
jgi:hypothetical protein